MKHLAARVAALVCLALLVAACGEEATTGPTAADYTAERERLVAQMAKNRGRPEPAAAPAAAEPAAAEEGGFGAMAAKYRYEKRGKRDPFRAYRHTNQPLGPTSGPLLAYELEQLSVVAVVWSTGKPRALVTDPRGETHVVREGSPIGKNDGLVIHIGDNMVLVKETYVDFAGEMTTKDVELRIRRSQGG